MTIETEVKETIKSVYCKRCGWKIGTCEDCQYVKDAQTQYYKAIKPYLRQELPAPEKPDIEEV